VSERITNGRKSDGRFVKGCKGGPGRPRGSKHKLSESLVSALAADFEEHGADAIRRTREDRPDQYLRLIASILPKELNISTEDPFDDVTDEQLTEMIMKLKAEIIEAAGGADEEVEDRAADKELH
jgi:hypothetical protein